MSPSPIEEFWQRYLDSLPQDAPRPTKYQAWHFTASPAGADELAELVKNGIKAATASLGWVYDWQNEPCPHPGDLSVITKWDSSPQCVIETTDIEIMPFDRVSAEFAAEEGEGTRSLAEWRVVHWRIFTEECAIVEREPNPNIPRCLRTL